MKSKKRFKWQILVYAYGIGFLIYLIPPYITAYVLLVSFSILLPSYLIYACIYFNSDEFKAIKKDFKDITQDVNNLNNHIEELKNVKLADNQTDYGTATVIDNSRYKYKRTAFSIYADRKNVYHCSRQVVSNAKQRPFEYICKYFNLPANEATLEYFEEMLNNFSAVEQGKRFLETRHNELSDSIKKRLPFLIRKISYRRAIRKIGVQKIDLNTMYFPSYIFQYISPGGNASLQAKIQMDIWNLEKMVNFLNAKIKWRKSVAGQRALMTRALREQIKERDKYTCKKCKNSSKKEPNLLLEIDHIKPLSKGGTTSLDNLQTLCWRCNRSKGAKYEE